MRALPVALTLCALAGCASLSRDSFDQRYGIAAHQIPVAGVYTGALDNAGETVRLFVAGNPDPGPH